VAFYFFQQSPLGLGSASVLIVAGSMICPNDAEASLYRTIEGRVLKKGKKSIVIKNKRGVYKLPKKGNRKIASEPLGKKVKTKTRLKSKVVFIPNKKRSSK